MNLKEEDEKSIWQLNMFTNSPKDKIHFYNPYGRSVVEHSCVVWSSNLTNKNIKKTWMSLKGGNYSDNKQ